MSITDTGARAKTLLLAAVVGFLAMSCASATASFLSDMRTGLADVENYTPAEIDQIGDEYLLLVGTDICDRIENRGSPGSYHDYAIEAATKHLC